MAIKICRTCKQELPDECFTKLKSSPDGLCYNCRTCKNKLQNERRKKIKSGEIHPQKRKDKPEVPDGFKFCYHCEKILPLDDFGSDKKSKDGKTLYCKSCAKQMYFEKHGESEKEKTIKLREELYSQGLGLCCVCKRVLPIENFTKNHRNKNGYGHVCKDCRKEEYENKIRNAEAEPSRTPFYLRDELAKNGLKRCGHCGKILPTSEFYKSSRKQDGLSSICKSCTKEIQNQNKDKRLEYYKEYERTGRDRGKRSARHKERMESDNIYRLKSKIRYLIYGSLNRKKYPKKFHSEEIIGISIEWFIKYLLSTFKNRYGREWDGVEKVHIDHIIPLATAKTEEEVIRLNHFSNLQLLTAEDNIKKKHKLFWI